MSEIDIHHLGAAYSLDALDERERVAFEAHYPSCEVCRADVLHFRATLGQLAEATALAPPPSLRTKVLDEIARTRQLSPLLPAAVSDLAERRSSRRRSVGMFLSAAAAVVAFVVGGVVMQRSDAPSYADDLASVLAADDGRIIALAGTAPSTSSATVKVAWSEATAQAVLLGDGLAQAPDGQAYELWMIGADGPVPMRVLDPASDGRIRTTLSVDGSPQAWGITLEPRAGSAAPTSDILYLGEA